MCGAEVPRKYLYSSASEILAAVICEEYIVTVLR